MVAWTSDDRASAAAQTPRITLIGRDDAFLRGAAAPCARENVALRPTFPGRSAGGPRHRHSLTSTACRRPARVLGPRSTPAGDDQRLANPGFEAETAGWVASSLGPGQRLGITQAVSHTGTRSAFMSAQPGTAPYLVQLGTDRLAGHAGGSVSPLPPGSRRRTCAAWPAGMSMSTAPGECSTTTS